MNASWSIFADLCHEAFEACSFKEQLLSECSGNEDIAWAVFFHFRGQSISWLHQAIPALEHGIPFELVRNGKGDLVRKCLQRVPC